MKQLVLMFLGCAICVNIMAQNENEKVKITFDGKNVKIENPVKEITIRNNDGHVDIQNPITDREIDFNLKGRSDDGSITYHGSYKTTFKLKGLDLKTSKGSVLDILCGKRIKIKLDDASVNSLADSNDTIHSGCIHAKGHIEMTGDGTLSITASKGAGIKVKEYFQLKSGKLNINAVGDGCKGIRCAEDVIIDGGELNIVTSGKYLSETRPNFMGMGGDIPDFGGMMGDFRPDSTMMGGFPGFPGGGFPDFGGMMGGFRPDSTMMGGFPGFPGGDFPGPPGGGFPDFGGMMGGPGNGGGRHFYEGTAKAIKALGTVTINGGNITLRTSTGGAEGLEGKKGITVNGGILDIKAHDDAISSNGKIVINGGKTTAWSMKNDAVDSNFRGEGAITITGGEIYALSQLGAPDEGLDCDFSPMIMTGGTVFSMGGSMGPHVTAPRKTDECPSFLVMQGTDLPEGKTLNVVGENGKSVFSYRIPFDMKQSYGVVSCPQMKKNSSYKIEIR